MPARSFLIHSNCTTLYNHRVFQKNRSCGTACAIDNCNIHHTMTCGRDRNGQRRLFTERCEAFFYLIFLRKGASGRVARGVKVVMYLMLMLNLIQITKE